MIPEEEPTMIKKAAEFNETMLNLMERTEKAINYRDIAIKNLLHRMALLESTVERLNKLLIQVAEKTEELEKAR